MADINVPLDTATTADSPQEAEIANEFQEGGEGVGVDPLRQQDDVEAELERALEEQEREANEMEFGDDYDFSYINTQYLEDLQKKNSTQDTDLITRKKITALDVKDHFLTTGCPNIDGFLNGGILRRGLIEIVGPSAVGKTQIALQLAITAQLPVEFGGFGSGVVYINTEGPFPSKRLMQLCKLFKAKYGPNLPEIPSDAIYIRQVKDTPSLLKCVTVELPKVLETQRIGLIIVDSIAATFRVEYQDKVQEKTKDLRLVGRSLHDIAFGHNLALVCINQVSGAVGSDSQDFAPSLGITWRNLVTTRIVVSRNDDGRLMLVPFSNYIPVRSISFEVGHDGVFSQDPRFNRAN